MSAPAPASRENPQLDLAALRRLKYDELERLYRAAKRPSALQILTATPWARCWRGVLRAQVRWPGC